MAHRESVRKNELRLIHNNFWYPSLEIQHRLIMAIDMLANAAHYFFGHFDLTTSKFGIKLFLSPPILGNFGTPTAISTNHVA